ncbi:MAG: hypothetical protein FJ318_02495 [SAR202 cluster bacterium]|nr:hypothetical protein [SAR202 cluster bacterium]
MDTRASEREPGMDSGFSILGWLAFAVATFVICLVPPILFSIIITPFIVLAGVIVAIGTLAVRATSRFRSVMPASTAPGADGPSSATGRLGWPVGWVEAALIAIAAGLVAFEVIALRTGMGAFYAVVLLGYFLAVGGAYLVFRRVRPLEQAQEAAEAGATLEAVRETSPAMAPGTLAAMVDDAATWRHAAEFDLLRALSPAEAERVLRLGCWTLIPEGTEIATGGMRGHSIFLR